MKVFATFVASKNLIHVLKAATASQNETWITHDRIEVFCAITMFKSRIFEYLPLH